MAEYQAARSVLQQASGKAYGLLEQHRTVGARQLSRLKDRVVLKGMFDKGVLQGLLQVQRREHGGFSQLEDRLFGGHRW
jgi:hypothetical protein